jgi:hypothetical protein
VLLLFLAANASRTIHSLEYSFVAAVYVSTVVGVCLAVFSAEVTNETIVLQRPVIGRTSPSGYNIFLDLEGALLSKLGRRAKAFCTSEDRGQKHWVASGST